MNEISPNTPATPGPSAAAGPAVLDPQPAEPPAAAGPSEVLDPPPAGPPAADGDLSHRWRSLTRSLRWRLDHLQQAPPVSKAKASIAPKAPACSSKSGAIAGPARGSVNWKMNDAIAGLGSARMRRERKKATTAGRAKEGANMRDRDERRRLGKALQRSIENQIIKSSLLRLSRCPDARSHLGIVDAQKHRCPKPARERERVGESLTIIITDDDSSSPSSS